MNPEFQRNTWLELSPMRLIMMPVVLGLIFAAIWNTTDIGGLEATTRIGAVDWFARAAFFFIVVIWGTWISARLVTGEIRARTWDTQRMSAISPFGMVTGKIFGGTIYVWYGGAVCLLVIAYAAARSEGPAAAIESILYWISIGLFAHITAFFVSMLAVRRGAATSRLVSFFALIIGIMAGWSVLEFWVQSQSTFFGMPIDGITDVTIYWFGIEVGYQTMQLVTLVLAVVWTFLGALVLMRHELQTQTGPWVWIGFVVYSMILYAGYADVIANLDHSLGDIAANSSKPGISSEEQEFFSSFRENVLTPMRWSIAAVTAMVLTYGAVFLAPKDWVQMRWVRDRFLHGRIDQAIMNLPAWLYSLIAVAVCALVLMTTFDPIELTPAMGDVARELDIVDLPSSVDPRAWIVAAFLFLVRDIGIVLWFNAGAKAKRPDIAALVTLVLLYWVVPVLLFATGLGSMINAVWAVPTEASWSVTIWPAAEAAGIFALVVARRASVRSRL